jgi:hypothetical protein
MKRWIVDQSAPAGFVSLFATGALIVLVGVFLMILLVVGSFCFQQYKNVRKFIESRRAISVVEGDKNG